MAKYIYKCGHVYFYLIYSPLKQMLYEYTITLNAYNSLKGIINIELTQILPTH